MDQPERAPFEIPLVVCVIERSGDMVRDQQGEPDGDRQPFLAAAA